MEDVLDQISNRRISSESSNKSSIEQSPIQSLNLQSHNLQWIMTLDKLRRLCMSLPAVTEQIQWGDNLVFKVGGKIFVIANTEPDAALAMSFKCSDEGFGELVECEGIVPAPYLARARWVALERFDALDDREIHARVREAYDLVWAKLPRATRSAITEPHAPRTSRPRRSARAR